LREHTQASGGSFLYHQQGVSLLDCCCKREVEPNTNCYKKTGQLGKNRNMNLGADWTSESLRFRRLMRFLKYQPAFESISEYDRVFSRLIFLLLCTGVSHGLIIGDIPLMVVGIWSMCEHTFRDATRGRQSSGVLHMVC
jgi:hypothetical protein